MSDLKWIFFDLGWTLVDETQAHHERLEAVSRYLNGIGLAHSVSNLVNLCESAASHYEPSPFHGMLACLNLSPEQLDELTHSARYVKEKEVLYPRVTEVLAQLAMKFRLGVIANQSRGTIDRLIRWDIRDHFSIIFASAELGLSKPDPRIFTEALGEARCEPEQALMVGDRIDNDIGPAKVQGWRTLLVRQGYSRFQEPRGSHEAPDLSIDAIGEMMDEGLIHRLSQA